MKSLKIIIFRDTDKPYTIIIPSTVLVAVAFVALALVTMLSFSLISNVLLYAKTKDQPQIQLASQTTPDQQDITAQDMDDPIADENDAQQSTDNDALDVDNGEVISTPDDAADGDTSQEDVDQPETMVDDNTQTDTPVENTVEQPMRAESYALTAVGANVRADVNGNIVNRENSVVLNAQVAKINPSNSAFTGRFIVAITDAQGNGGSTYPEGLVVSDGRVETPQRGTTFSIRRLRNYNSIQLPKQASIENAFIMLFVYTEDGSKLLWRKAVPLP